MENEKQILYRDHDSIGKSVVLTNSLPRILFFVADNCPHLWQEPRKFYPYCVHVSTCIFVRQTCEQTLTVALIPMIFFPDIAKYSFFEFLIGLKT